MDTNNQVSIVKCPSCGKGNRVRAVASGAPHCGACGKALPWLVEADQSSFHTAVEQSPLPVLVDFWAPWCGPCRMVAPVVEEIAKERADALKVVKLNVDENQQTAVAYDVMSIPTLILFSGGEVAKKIIGAYPKRKLEAELEPSLA